MRTTIFFILTAALYSGSCNAQNSVIPEPVKAAFAKLHPSVTTVEWEKEGANYEAEFKIDHKESSVLFDANGTVLETETEISVSELPKAVTDYVTKNYPGSTITEAAKITDANGTVTYEAEISKGDLIFDAQGIFIKLIKKEGGDEEEDD